MTNPLNDPLLTVPEACRAVRVSHRTFYNLIGTRSLNAVKLGRRTYVRQSEIDRFIAELPAYGAAA